MFLHERDAGDDFLACFKGHEGVCPKSVVHCYTGDKETLARMLDMGFYIGITGWICDERRANRCARPCRYYPWIGFSLRPMLRI